jgi:hypothetical protein
MGHSRRSVLRRVSSSGTWLGIAVQGRVLRLFNHPVNYPVGRPGRDVPFLTGQKGDGKSRRAVRAAADGPAPRRGRESELARMSAMTSLRHRFAKRPSAGQNHPRRRTAKGPGKDRLRKGGGQARGTSVRLFCVEKRVDREKISTRDSDGGMVDPTWGVRSRRVDPPTRGAYPSTYPHRTLLRECGRNRSVSCKTNPRTGALR